MVAGSVVLLVVLVVALVVRLVGFVVLVGAPVVLGAGFAGLVVPFVMLVVRATAVVVVRPCGLAGGWVPRRAVLAGRTIGPTGSTLCPLIDTDHRDVPCLPGYLAGKVSRDRTYALELAG